MLPVRETVPPGSTVPRRRPKGSGTGRTAPRASSFAFGPSTRVARGTSLFTLAAFESPAVSVIWPPGAVRLPSSKTVRPAREILPPGSTESTAPRCITRSPRSRGTSRIPSRTPAAVKLSSAAGRAPGSRSTSRRTGVPPGPSSPRTTERTTGATTVPPATTRPGSSRPSSSRPGRPVRLQRLKPPASKKPGPTRKPSGRPAPPTRTRGAVMVSEPPRAPDKPDTTAPLRNRPPTMPSSCGS